MVQVLIKEQCRRTDTRITPDMLRWRTRNPAPKLTTNPGLTVLVGRERLRQLPHKHEITFQRTKTWKESNDPQREAKLAGIEHVMHHFPRWASRSTSSGR